MPIRLTGEDTAHLCSSSALLHLEPKSPKAFAGFISLPSYAITLRGCTGGITRSHCLDELASVILVGIVHKCRDLQLNCDSAGDPKLFMPFHRGNYRTSIFEKVAQSRLKLLCLFLYLSGNTISQNVTQCHGVSASNQELQSVLRPNCCLAEISRNLTVGDGVAAQLLPGWIHANFDWFKLLPLIVYPMIQIALQSSPSK